MPGSLLIIMIILVCYFGDNMGVYNDWKVYNTTKFHQVIQEECKLVKYASYLLHSTQPNILAQILYFCTQLALQTIVNKILFPW